MFIGRPQIETNRAAELADELFGLKVKKIRELNGYDDKNYHVFVEDSANENESSQKTYVLKIVNSSTSDDLQCIEAQNAMLLYVAKSKILCPLPILSIHKTYCPKVTLPSGKHVVRLLEYIDGEILCKAECTPNIFYQIGILAGELDKILKNFRHPSYDTYTHQWTMEHLPDLNQYLPAISISDKSRKMVENIVKDFSSRVLSIKDTLERGLIHGDINEQNIIVERLEDTSEWTFKAIIDFNDATVSCYLFELAITMAYMMLQEKSLDVGGYVLAGYTSIRNLPDKEFSLLKICVAARLSQSVVIGAYSSLKDPNNQYVLTTAKEGWKLLTEIWEVPEETLLENWKNIAENFRATL